MAGIFSGLESLGLGNLAGAELFEKEKPKEEEQKGIYGSSYINYNRFRK